MSSSRPAVRPRGLVAQSGLIVALALICLMAPMVPGLAVRIVFGALLLAAAGLALLTAPVADHAGARLFRIAWPVLTASAGLMMLGSTFLPQQWLGFGLAAYLAAQGVALFLFASHARRSREIGGPALTFEGVVSLALAAWRWRPFRSNRTGSSGRSSRWACSTTPARSPSSPWKRRCGRRRSGRSRRPRRRRG